MPASLVLAPSPDPRVFLAPDGTRLVPPSGWVCLPPGDATFTRRVKGAGPSWAVVEKRGRKVFSKGLWAPAECVAQVRAALEVALREGTRDEETLNKAAQRAAGRLLGQKYRRQPILLAAVVVL